MFHALQINGVTSILSISLVSVQQFEEFFFALNCLPLHFGDKGLYKKSYNG